MNIEFTSLGRVRRRFGSSNFRQQGFRTRIPGSMTDRRKEAIMGLFKRGAREVTRGVFTAMPSTKQVEDTAFPLEWEEDIPDLISGIKCTCGNQLQLVRKHAVHGPSFLGAGFIGKTYLVAECSCSCGEKYYVATAPSKILKHWIGG